MNNKKVSETPLPDPWPFRPSKEAQAVVLKLKEAAVKQKRPFDRSKVINAAIIQFGDEAAELVLEEQIAELRTHLDALQKRRQGKARPSPSGDEGDAPSRPRSPIAPRPVNSRPPSEGVKILSDVDKATDKPAR